MSTTEKDYLASVRKIIEELTGIPAEQIAPEQDLAADLDIDSLTMVEIAVAIQDEFEVDVDQDALMDIKTVQDAVDLIKATG